MASADHIAWLHRGGRSARWGNLGLWIPGQTRDYADACRDLAHAVGAAAGMGPGDSVLSLACGAGEELTLWAEAFGAATVMGLEQNPTLAAQARQRAEAAHASCDIEVHCADARRIAQLIGGRFDRIVCVDALYHLGARAPLLRAVRARLFPGGAFAFTDLVLDRRGGVSWRQAALRLGAGLTGIDAGELRSPVQGVALLREAGFDDAQVTRLDEAVLDGFCAYAERQARRIGLAGRLSAGWRRVALTAALIRAGRGAGLGYALFCGRVNAAPPTDGDPPDAWAATAPEETLAP